MPRTSLLRVTASLLALALVLAQAGCASTYAVKVNSIRRPAGAKQEITSYKIHTRTRVEETDRLRFQEAANHIRTALSAKGLYEAPDANSADMIVEVDYGMTAPKSKRQQYQELVFNTPAVDRSWDRGPAADQPMLEFEDAERRIVVREKQLSICGRENKPAGDGQPPQELWHVSVSIEDESRDLRGYLPLLASVAMDQIERETNGETTTMLRDDDQAVVFIKKGM